MIFLKDNNDIFETYKFKAKDYYYLAFPVRFSLVFTFLALSTISTVPLLSITTTAFPIPFIVVLISLGFILIGILWFERCK